MRTHGEIVAAWMLNVESGGGNKQHSPSIATLRKYAEAGGCYLEIRLRPRGA
jgi:hypothetical protein